MLFSSIFLKTLRDFRVAILGWGLGMGLILFVVLEQFPALVQTAAARASLVTLGSSFAAMAAPVKIDTPGGYATWKYGIVVMLVALWPLVAASRVMRGEEERGAMDVLLSLPRGRVRVALEKIAAIWTALLLISVLVALFAFAGGERVNAGFGAGGALLFGLDAALLAAVFGGIALFISQFTQERSTAAGATGGLLVLSIVLDMVHRVVPNTEWISQLSPVYYFNASKPLVPSYGTNVGAMLVMLGLSIILSAGALWLFARRDIGGTVALPRWLQLPRRAPQPRALPTGDWSLRSIYARGVAMVAVPTAWWTLGIAGFAGWTVVIVQQSEAQLVTLAKSSPLLRTYLSRIGGGDITSNATLLSSLFSFLPLLMMAFAITQANRWAADEEEGRLEIVLSTPQPRLRVLLGRFAALTTATVVVGLLTLAVTAAVSAATGVRLDGGNLAAAALTMIPLALLVAALGYLLSGWLRTAVDTGLLSFVVLAWFLISDLGPVLNWPEATLRLSALYYYGTPLLHGVQLPSLLALLAAGAVALGAGSLRFARKDIGG